MKPELRRVGAGASPVVVVDHFSGDVGAVVEVAAALAPFPFAHGSHYPGLRRVVTPSDRAADAYVRRTLQAAAPFIAGAFDCDRFDLIEASFSMVTAPPERLSEPQRGAHFDSVDPDYLAVMHYLAQTEGTAFYRQRGTGVETVTPENLEAFVACARRDSPGLRGYLGPSNAAFERIGVVEGLADRLVVYPGRLLHSGLIPPGAALSADPRKGRLTANFFVRARR